MRSFGLPVVSLTGFVEEKGGLRGPPFEIVVAV